MGLGGRSYQTYFSKQPAGETGNQPPPVDGVNKAEIVSWWKNKFSEVEWGKTKIMGDVTSWGTGQYQKRKDSFKRNPSPPWLLKLQLDSYFSIRVESNVAAGSHQSGLSTMVRLGSNSNLMACNWKERECGGRDSYKRIVKRQSLTWVSSPSTWWLPSTSRRSKATHFL